ncbi:MAG: hypothetical protein NVS3B16_12610 [Vulcanimicrobiaceae bacterium]
MRVLMIEDNPGDSRLVCELLSEVTEPVSVEGVTTLAGGIAALDAAPFEVVLLDMSLPDGEGIDLVRRVRSVAATVPIVVLTGQGDDDLARRAVREGAQDYLIKGSVDGAALHRSLQYAIDRAAQIERITSLAYVDALTGLRNRTFFVEHVTLLVAAARRNLTPLALLFVDLDGFKAINDRLGHAAGDVVLATTAQRLRASVRESDLVVRLGGDEFTITLISSTSPAEIELVARRILDSLTAAIDVDGVPARTSASIGIARFPGDAKDFAGLVQRADAAMYRAKSAGKNRYSF